MANAAFVKHPSGQEFGTTVPPYIVMLLP